MTDLMPGLIGDEDLRRLTYYSGGRARDFVRLVRELAGMAYLRKAPAIDGQMVDAAIDAARRLLETGLNRAHIDLLRSVIEDPLHQLPDSELVSDMLVSSRLLPYPNESEWFYPHPLLTRRLLKRWHEQRSPG